MRILGRRLGSGLRRGLPDNIKTHDNTRSRLLAIVLYARTEFFAHRPHDALT